ncbi:hypothetical protein [Bosea massiliensis]|uniref:N-acetyltransferase domain-containing protein n=1 Tax=Bosea massiliensis TaxID=151419 RepID=A0ABW0P7G9_9HYPH
MTTPRVVASIEGSELAFALLLQDGFSGSAFAATIKRELTPDFLSWKYSSPAGKSVLAVVERSGVPIAMVSASPLRLQDRNAGVRRAWQIGDIVTALPHRGQGLFRDCLAALVASLPAGDVVLCYPNANSRRELLNQGFTAVVDLAYSARPALWWSRASVNRLVKPLSFFGDLLHLGSHDMHVARDADYLNWRYLDCPSRTYTVLIEGAANNPEGVLIFRRFNDVLPIAVIMDLLGTEAAVVRLLSQLDREARKQGLPVIMTIDAQPVGEHPTYPTMLRVPRPLQPKRMTLLAKIAGAPTPTSATSAEWRRTWHIQAGDWDGL